MKRSTKKIFSQLKRISFPKGESDEVFNTLNRYANDLPGSKSFLTASLLVFIRQYSVVTVAVFVFVFSIAGLVPLSLAMKSLPGDALYSVKVSVSERVSGFIANVSSESKVEWDFAILDRRLEEGKKILEKNPKNDIRVRDIELSSARVASAVETALRHVNTSSNTTNSDPEMASSLYFTLEQKLGLYEDALLSLNDSSTTQRFIEET